MKPSFTHRELGGAMGFLNKADWAAMGRSFAPGVFFFGPLQLDQMSTAATRNIGVDPLACFRLPQDDRLQVLQQALETVWARKRRELVEAR